MIAYAVYFHHNSRFAVKCGVNIRFGKSVPNIRNIAEPNAGAVRMSNNRNFSIFLCHIPALFHPDKDFTAGRLQTAARQLYGNRSNPVRHFADGQIITTKLVHGNIHLDFIIPDTVQHYLCDFRVLQQHITELFGFFPENFFFLISVNHIRDHFALTGGNGYTWLFRFFRKCGDRIDLTFNFLGKLAQISTFNRFYGDKCPAF